MSARGVPGGRPAAVSGPRGVLTTVVLSRTGRPYSDRPKGKIVDDSSSRSPAAAVAAAADAAASS